MTQQQTFETAFHATGQTVIDAEYWNRFVLEIAARFRGLDGIKVAWEEVSRQGIDVALARINETLGPAAQRIQALSGLGFLVAASETPATLGVGEVLDLVVTEGDARDLFTPSPYVMLSRSLSAADYAVAKLRSYDRDTGLLQTEVVSFAGDPGPHADWSIGAIAGSTLAQLLMLGQGQAAQAATLALRTATGVDRAAVAADRTAVANMRADVLAMADDAAGASEFDARITANADAITATNLAADRRRGRRRLKGDLY